MFLFKNSNFSIFASIHDLHFLNQGQGSIFKPIPIDFSHDFTPNRVVFVKINFFSKSGYKVVFPFKLVPGAENWSMLIQERLKFIQQS